MFKFNIRAMGSLSLIQDSCSTSCHHTPHAQAGTHTCTSPAATYGNQEEKEKEGERCARLLKGVTPALPFHCLARGWLEARTRRHYSAWPRYSTKYQKKYC